MKIPCFRCGEKIDTPDAKNADYIIAPDTIVRELGEKAIQKTGIVCPECYEDTDFVIWGIHKGR